MRRLVLYTGAPGGARGSPVQRIVVAPATAQTAPESLDGERLGRVVLGFSLGQWIRVGLAAGLAIATALGAAWQISSQYATIEHKLDDHGRRLTEIESCLDRIAPRTVAAPKVHP